MGINQLQLPSTQAFTPDVSGTLAGIGETLRKAQADAARQQALSQLGQGGAADTQTLIRSGDPTLLQLGMTMQQRQQDMDRQGRLDERTIKNDEFGHGIQLENLKIAKANLANNSEGPEETAAQRASVARSYGIDPTTPAGKSFILTGKLPEADTSFQSTIEQRKQAAISIGLDPSSPGYQSFVLTGKMPREDAQPLTAGDKEAIRTADDAIVSNRSAIDSLTRAKQLSKQAFAGPGAGVRGYAASFLGDTSDIGKAGIATENLTNEVMTNSLGQLKAIFGGNPTEGERKILLDLQGSASKPDSVRQAIFDRASALAQKRLEFNQQRADQLRGNTYYKPQGSNGRAPMTASQSAISQQQYEALPSGTPFTAPDGSQRIKP